jgi:hypothetical protein
MFLYMFPNEMVAGNMEFILGNYHTLTQMTEQEIFGE